jgi:Ca2+-binding RTX toxin-like protein
VRILRVALLVALAAAGGSAAGGGGGVHFAGTPADDEVHGSPVRDTLYGARGDDRLSGLHGRDWLSGGPGDDRLQGGGGADSLSAGPGNDRLRGGIGADLLFGNAGEDVIDARDTHASLRNASECAGGPPPSYCRPRGSADGVWAGSQDDIVLARDGRVDFVWCEGGRDVVVADRNDRLPVGDCEVVRH